MIHDPEFREWESELVGDEAFSFVSGTEPPLRYWGYAPGPSATTGTDRMVNYLLSFKPDRIGSIVDAMDAEFSRVKDWNYGDVL